MAAEDAERAEHAEACGGSGLAFEVVASKPRIPLQEDSGWSFALSHAGLDRHGAIFWVTSTLTAVLANSLA